MCKMHRKKKLVEDRRWIKLRGMGVRNPVVPEREREGWRTITAFDHSSFQLRCHQMAIYLFFTLCSWSMKHVYSLILLCVDVSIFLLLVTRRDERHEVTGCLIAWKFFAGDCISWAKLYPLLGSSLKSVILEMKYSYITVFLPYGKFLVYWGRWIVGKDKGEVNDGFTHINMNYFPSNALELRFWREQSPERKVEGFQKQIMMTSSFSLGHWS